jgi:general L-amino acid transport system permease protein
MPQLGSTRSSGIAVSPPTTSIGPIVWARRNLFSSISSTFITLVSAALASFLTVFALKWLVIDAAWRGTSLADCPSANGACWPFVQARYTQFIYGFYPDVERWRINLAFVLGAAVASLLMLRPVRKRMSVAVGPLLAWPVVAGVLLHGGIFGLVPVETARWGGFSLTVFMATSAIAISVPAGILLALARTSHKLVVRSLAACWVEFWRAVPMLPVLFVAVSMFPLFMPENIQVDRFTRAMAAFVIVTTCFIAEAVRGGLQAVPRSQYEAARSLGLGYWRATTLIVLPQAFSISLPSIVNVAIVLFKDTTLVNVIGIFCLLGMIQTAATSPQWISEQSILTGYAAAASVYWVCCFVMSRIGVNLEARLRRGSLADRSRR